MANADTVMLLQSSILMKPYNIGYRLNLAEAYKQCQYPDLAAGEAYIALLLIDEASDESSDYFEDTIAATKDAISVSNDRNKSSRESSSKPNVQCDDMPATEDAISRELNAWSLHA